jgi:hypothetical protein
LSSYTQGIRSVEAITVSLYIYQKIISVELFDFFPDIYICFNLLAIERKIIFCVYLGYRITELFIRIKKPGCFKKPGFSTPQIVKTHIAILIKV